LINSIKYKQTPHDVMNKAAIDSSHETKRHTITLLI